MSKISSRTRNKTAQRQPYARDVLYTGEMPSGRPSIKVDLTEGAGLPTGLPRAPQGGSPLDNYIHARIQQLGVSKYEVKLTLSVDNLSDVLTCKLDNHFVRLSVSASDPRMLTGAFTFHIDDSPRAVSPLVVQMMDSHLEVANFQFNTTIIPAKTLGVSPKVVVPFLRETPLEKNKNDINLPTRGQTPASMPMQAPANTPTPIVNPDVKIIRCPVVFKSGSPYLMIIRGVSQSPTEYWGIPITNWLVLRAYIREDAVAQMISPRWCGVKSGGRLFMFKMPAVYPMDIPALNEGKPVRVSQHKFPMGFPTAGLTKAEFTAHMDLFHGDICEVVMPADLLK